MFSITKASTEITKPTTKSTNAPAKFPIVNRTSGLVLCRADFLLFFSL